MDHRRPVAFAFGLLATAAIGGLTLIVMDLRTEVRRLAAADEAAQAQLTVVAREVTRFRIEQRAEGRGPQALLEKLRVYAPILTSARTTQPDYLAARSEMDAILLAFESLGDDAYQSVRRRFDGLSPDKEFDEMRWLLEAATRSNPQQGQKLVEEVLLGAVKPAPRLRWAAADLLLRIDRPAAQRLLRRIMVTESSRGLDPNRAAAYNLPMIDPAATALAGFDNFLTHYLRSEDPETEETLLQVLMRTEEDTLTLQKTIEVLGQRKSERARARIEELYLHPPGAQQNPLFLNECLDALVRIRGAAARPWLEEQLGHAEHELVQQHIEHLLKDLK